MYLMFVCLFVKDISAMSVMEIDTKVLEQPVHLTSSSKQGIIADTIKKYLDNVTNSRTNPIVFNLGRINLQLGTSGLRAIISSLHISGVPDVIINNITVSGKPSYFDFTVPKAQFLSENTSAQVLYDDQIYTYMLYMRVVATNIRLTGRAEYDANLPSTLEIVDSDIITGDIQANISLYGQDMDYTLKDRVDSLDAEIGYLKQIYEKCQVKWSNCTPLHPAAGANTQQPLLFLHTGDGILSSTLDTQYW